MTEQLILQHIHEMPEHLRREVLDFIDALLTKHRAASSASAKNIDPEGAKGYLSKEDIVKLYPEKWVVLVNFRIEGTELMGGKVLFHDKNKKDLALRAQQTPLPNTPKMVYYTGTLPNRPSVGLMLKVV